MLILDLAESSLALGAGAASKGRTKGLSGGGVWRARAPATLPKGQDSRSCVLSLAGYGGHWCPHTWGQQNWGLLGQLCLLPSVHLPLCHLICSRGCPLH